MIGTEVSQGEHRSAVLARRAKIFSLEDSMRALPEHLIDIETRHHFAGGVYAREVRIPAGALVTGKIHRTEHLTTVSQGRILVVTETEEFEVVAPATFVAPPGVKRAVYALEDTVWTTYHATPETDLEKIEAALIAPSFEALERSESTAIAQDGA